MTVIPTAVHTTISTYNDLLDMMGQLTDRLSEAVADLRLPDIEQMIGEREALCLRVAASAQDLRMATEWLDPNCVAGLLDRTRQLEKTILTKQASCEVAIGEKMAKCRSHLVELRRKKTVWFAYGPSAGTNQASFLDNRI